MNTSSRIPLIQHTLKYPSTLVYLLANRLIRGADLWAGQRRSDTCTGFRGLSGSH